MKVSEIKVGVNYTSARWMGDRLVTSIGGTRTEKSVIFRDLRTGRIGRSPLATFAAIAQGRGPVSNVSISSAEQLSKLSARHHPGARRQKLEAEFTAAMLGVAIKTIKQALVKEMPGSSFPEKTKAELAGRYAAGKMSLGGALESQRFRLLNIHVLIPRSAH